MFCPECKAEYRPGFTHCSDCDVDLVTHLPAEVPTNAPRFADAHDAPADDNGNLLLWSGVDPEVYDAICAALDASNIAHTDTDREFGLPSLGQKVLLIWVNPRDWRSANAILENALEQPLASDRDDLRAQAHARSLDPFRFGQPIYTGETAPERRVNPFAAVSTESLFADREDAAEATPDDVATNFRAQDATQEVWSGKDSDMAEMVRLCLRENGIGCVAEERGAERAVLVTPESESRAKEIVDQIVRGTPG